MSFVDLSCEAEKKVACWWGLRQGGQREKERCLPVFFGSRAVSSAPSGLIWGPCTRLLELG